MLVVTPYTGLPPPEEVDAIVNVFPDTLKVIPDPAAKFTAPVSPLTEVTDPPPPAGVAQVIPLPVDVNTWLLEPCVPFINKVFVRFTGPVNVPPEALIPAVNLVSALKVPPTITEAKS